MKDAEISAASSPKATPIGAQPGAGVSLSGQQIIDLVHAVVGLRLREQDLAAVHNWIARRMHARGLASEGAYLRLLQEGGAAGCLEREELTVQLTTGETYFLRDPDQFRLLAEQILPELIERRSASRRLRLWSAGCASGEEAYTLAMLLNEMRPKIPGWEIEIIATDINTRALDIARRGRYGEWSFRALDEERKHRYFHHEGREWVIVPALRELVRFARTDLVADQIPDADGALQQFDLIMCRNVFIYMQALAVSRVATKLTAALAEGGYLITGHGELLGHNTQGLQSSVFAESVVMHKLAAPEAPAALPIARLKAAVHASPPAKAAAAQALRRSAAPTSPAEWRPAPEDLVQQAWRHADRGEAKEAEQACRGALLLAPLNPWPYYLLAQLAQERGDVRLARAMLDKVIYLDPSLVAAYLELSALLEQGGHPERARRMLQTACLELRKLPAAAPIKPYDNSTAGPMLSFLESRLRNAAPGAISAPPDRSAHFATH